MTVAKRRFGSFATGLSQQQVGHVRYVSESDRSTSQDRMSRWAIKRHFRLSEMPISPLALRLITAALLELCEDLF